jgi:hypothetical protein
MSWIDEVALEYRSRHPHPHSLPSRERGFFNTLPTLEPPQAGGSGREELDEGNT